MFNAIKRIFHATLNLFVPRSYILQRAQADITVLSEVSAHLMVARAKLYTAINASTASGMPLVMPESPGSITLSNGHKLTIEFDRVNPTRMSVGVGTWHKDYVFEVAVWEMLQSSLFFGGYNTTTDMVKRHGLSNCLVAGIDTATLAKNLGAMRIAGEQAMMQS